MPGKEELGQPRTTTDKAAATAVATVKAGAYVPHRFLFYNMLFAPIPFTIRFWFDYMKAEDPMIFRLGALSAIAAYGFAGALFEPLYDQMVHSTEEHQAWLGKLSGIISAINKSTLELVGAERQLNDLLSDPDNIDANIGVDINLIPLQRPEATGSSRYALSSRQIEQLQQGQLGRWLKEAFAVSAHAFFSGVGNMGVVLVPALLLTCVVIEMFKGDFDSAKDGSAIKIISLILAAGYASKGIGSSVLSDWQRIKHDSATLAELGTKYTELTNAYNGLVEQIERVNTAKQAVAERLPDGSPYKVQNSNASVELPALEFFRPQGSTEQQSLLNVNDV